MSIYNCLKKKKSWTHLKYSNPYYNKYVKNIDFSVISLVTKSSRNNVYNNGEEIIFMCWQELWQ